MPVSSEYRAPGKLVLAGEYAVLDGAPALVLAIDRGGVRCRYTAEGTEVVIDTPDGDNRFVRKALREAPAGRYCFESIRPVLDIEGKPGFGGSAAATVAACLAAGRRPEDAFAIHHAVQQGGSGVDVAASITGGLIRYCCRDGTPHSIDPIDCQVEPVVIWSGASARTGPRVQRYLQWSGRIDFVDASAGLVDQFPFDPVGVLAQAAELLLEMARAAGLDYRTPALDRIATLALAHGGAAKPSGAGGGDCAVALFPSPTAARAFEAACVAEGWPPIPIQRAPGAGRVEPG